MLFPGKDETKKASGSSFDNKGYHYDIIYARRSQRIRNREGEVNIHFFYAKRVNSVPYGIANNVEKTRNKVPGNEQNARRYAAREAR